MNTAWWAGKDWSLHPDQIAKSKAAGLSVWRFPGGSASNEYVWNRKFDEFPTRIPGILDPWTLDTDAFLKMIKAKGATGLITINYGIARQHGIEKAKKLAAEWVRKVNIEQKANVRYWEIGNEVFASWEAGFKVGETVTTGELYGAHFIEIAKAMKEVDPTIKVGACIVPEDAKGTYTSGGYDFWTRRMLPVVKDHADFMIVHDYFAWPYDAKEKFIPQTPEMCFARLKRISEIRRLVDTACRKYAGKTYPIALTEFNIVLGNSGPTVEFTNTAFTTLLLCELHEQGFFMANYWDWKNGWDNKPREEGGQGEHGILASGRESPMPEGTPYAPYAAYVLHQRFIGERLTRLTRRDDSVQVFVSERSDGSQGLLLVNIGGVAKQVAFRTNRKQFHFDEVTGSPPNTWETRRVVWNRHRGHPMGGVPFPLPDEPEQSLGTKGGRLSITVRPRSIIAGVLR
jgi:hypothetical protein